MKTFKVLIFLSFIGGVLISCNQDTKSQSNQYQKLIIGKWYMYKYASNQKADTSLNLISAYKLLTNYTWMEFLPDGTINTYILNGKTSGKWKLKDKRLIVYDKKGREEYTAKILKLTENELILYKKEGKIEMALFFYKKTNN